MPALFTMSSHPRGAPQRSHLQPDERLVVHSAQARCLDRIDYVFGESESDRHTGLWIVSASPGRVAVGRFREDGHRASLAELEDMPALFTRTSSYAAQLIADTGTWQRTSFCCPT
jgi:hypothetical protein